MRFYAIKIDGNVPGMSANSGAGVSGAQFCSVVNGANDPGALDVEFNIASTTDAYIATGSYIRIWGIPFITIAQINQLNDLPISVSGGMTDGLPLATFQSKYQGELAHGRIWPSLGNWIGTELFIELNLMPGPPKGMGSPNGPKNIVHNWPANTKLSQSLENTLKIAFPTMQRDIKISPNLKRSYADLGFYNSIEQFAQYIHATSLSILGNQKNYKGVKTAIKGNTIQVTDGIEDPEIVARSKSMGTNSTSSGQIAIDYRDLIGQPAWINSNTIQVNCVMRSDIHPDTNITLPPNTLITMQSSDAALAFAKSNVSTPNLSKSNQKFKVNLVNHWGHFRQNDSFSWRTTIDCVID